MCDHTNAHDRPITVWCIGSMVGAHKETICQTHINVPSPYGDLDMKSNQVTPGETMVNGRGALDNHSVLC